MKNFYSIFLVMFCFSFSIAQPELINHRAIILGNIGDVKNHDEFIQKLENRLGEIESPFTVLLNGDVSDNNVIEGADRLVLTKKNYGLGPIMFLATDMWMRG